MKTPASTGIDWQAVRAGLDSQEWQSSEDGKPGLRGLR